MDPPNLESSSRTRPGKSQQQWAPRPSPSLAINQSVESRSARKYGAENEQDTRQSQIYSRTEERQSSHQHSTGRKREEERMAANFWTSSHYKQLLEQEEVDVVNPLDREKGITVEDFKLMKWHMSNYIWKLAQQIKVRQRVVATAVAYMRRVYTRISMSQYDPRLVAPTCLYLAAKAEESPLQARLLVFYIKKSNSDEKYRYEIKDILEMEMKVLEALDYYLVVFHPYRSLSQLLQDAGMIDINMIQLSWGLVNDTYKMDLILMHPPHLIALACIFIASVQREKDITTWFEELRVDMNVVKNISMEILDFYEGHRLITEERISAAFGKLVSKP